MDLQFVPAEPLREGHLGERLAGAAPYAFQRAERRTEIDPGGRPRPVVGAHVPRRQRGLQGLQVSPSAGLRRPRVRRDPALEMQGPLTLGPLAEDLDAARRPRLGRVERDLQFPARLVRSAIGLGLREDQRVVQLHVLEGDGSAALGQRRRHRHRPGERPRRDQPFEHPVVVQPGRLGGEHFRLEGDLAARGLVPDPQQGVARGLAPALRRLEPVPLALERIAGHGEAPPLLAREETLETHLEAGFVGLRDSLEEVCVTCGRFVAGRRPLAGDHRRRLGGRRRRPRGHHHGGEHRARADLHHQVHAESGERAHALRERHRLAGVASPVGAVQRIAGADGLARQVAHERDAGTRDLRVVEDGRELRERRLHERAVERARRVEPPDPDPVFLEPFRNAFDPGLRAAHHLVGAVVRRDVHRQPG